MATEQIGIRIDVNLLIEIKQEAEHDGRSLSNYINWILLNRNNTPIKD